MSRKQVAETRGPWTITDKEIAYDNPWIEVTDHGVLRPDGSPGQYGVVHFKNKAIGVLPLTRSGTVWLVRQYRFALDKPTWELPEGGGPHAISNLDAAKRELKEETGLRAETWTPLLRSHLSNSVTDEVAFGFLATGLTEGETELEPSEDIVRAEVPFHELLERVLAGEITDALTQLMALTAYAKAQERSLPDEICSLLLKA